MGDLHINVIGHDSQVIKWLANFTLICGSGDHHVAPEITTLPSHATADKILPGDRAVIVNPEPYHREAALGLESCLLLWGEMAMAIIIAGGFAPCSLGLSHGIEFSGSAITAVGKSCFKKGLDGLMVETHAIGLEERSLIPGDVEPAETLKDVLGVFRPRSLYICILNPQNKLATMMASIEPVKDSGASGTNMQISSRTRGNTDSNSHGTSSYT
jgi:hypothetical protein